MKTKLSEFGEHLQALLSEMMSRVGMSPTAKKRFRFEDRWYTKKTWTDEQRDGYRDWFVEYLRNDVSARREICSNPSNRTKKYLHKVWEQWDFLYGWKRSE
jgi:hypothetical protein